MPILERVQRLQQQVQQLTQQLMSLRQLRMQLQQAVAVQNVQAQAQAMTPEQGRQRFGQLAGATPEQIEAPYWKQVAKSAADPEKLLALAGEVTGGSQGISGPRVGWNFPKVNPEFLGAIDEYSEKQNIPVPTSTDWQNVATSDPNIQAWFDQLKTPTRANPNPLPIGTDLIKFMQEGTSRYDSGKGEGYDYASAITAGERPQLNKLTGEYHWEEEWKGERHPTKGKALVGKLRGISPTATVIERELKGVAQLPTAVASIAKNPKEAFKNDPIGTIALVAGLLTGGRMAWKKWGPITGKLKKSIDAAVMESKNLHYIREWEKALKKSGETKLLERQPLWAQSGKIAAQRTVVTAGPGLSKMAQAQIDRMKHKVQSGGKPKSDVLYGPKIGAGPLKKTIEGKVAHLKGSEWTPLWKNPQARKAAIAGDKLTEFHTGITPVTILQGVETAGKTVPRFLRQARKRGETKPYTELMDDIEYKSDPRRAQLEGTALEKLRDAGMFKGDKKIVKSGELADMLEINHSHSAPYRKILDEMYVIAKKSGVPVVAFKRKYFPKLLNNKTADVLWDDLTTLERKHDILSKVAGGQNLDDLNRLVQNSMKVGFKPTTRMSIEYLLKTGQASHPLEAFVKLQRQVYDDLYNQFGNLERHRILDLPTEFYNRNAAEVLQRYVKGWSKRVAEVETFGSKGERLSELLNDIDKLNPGEALGARKIYDLYTGQYELQHRLHPILQKVVDGYTATQIGTKIALGRATILNVFQTLISSAAEAGWVRTGASLGRLLSQKGLRKRIRQSGAVNQANRSAVEAIAGEAPGGVLGKVSDKLATGSGFKGINWGNQYMAAAVADDWVQALHRTANGKLGLGNKIVGKLPGYRGQPQARAQALLKERFGVDYTKPLTEQARLKAMYRFATDTQLQKNVLRDPILANDPRFRPFFLFKRFGGRQIALIKDRTIKSELLQHRNPLPLARLIAGGALGGKAAGEAVRFIKRMLSGESMSKEDKGWVNNRIEELATAGAFGYVADVIDAENKLRSAKFMLSPVQVSDVEKVWILADRVYRDLDKYTLSDVAHRAIKPGSRLLGSYPAALGRRLQTPGQKKGEKTFNKGKQRNKLLGAIVNDKPDETERIIKNWYNKYPGTPLINPDENIFNLVADYMIRNEKRRLNP